MIHIRSGSNEALAKQIITELSGEKWGYVNLDVNSLISQEERRKTAIGHEFITLRQQHKLISPDLIVRMLRPIVYSGVAKNFILSNLPIIPDQIDQLRHFESTCCGLSAVIYPSQADSPVIEIKNNNLAMFDIESHFQKTHKLKPLQGWDAQKWAEIDGKLDWSIVVGMPFQGRSSLVAVLGKIGWKTIDWKAVEERVKKSLGTEEEPFEGKVPIGKVEDAVVQMIEQDKKAGVKAQYVFDSFPLHQSSDDFYAFTANKLKCIAPDYVFDLRNAGVSQDMAMARYKKKLEAEELSEEQKTAFANDFISWEVKTLAYLELLTPYIQSGRTHQVTTIRTDAVSESTQVQSLSSLLNPRVILVNHEKSLLVDTTCANIAIKYNMLQVNVQEVIRKEIESKSDLGLKLLQTKKEKQIIQGQSMLQAKDEGEYSPVHFDLTKVIEVLKAHITKVRTQTQRYILIDGMCNSNKLANIEDKMELRLMDEFFAVEKLIGEVQGIISMQYRQESE